MKPFSQWKDERGFTIQELMVVIIVGSMLVTFSFSLFLFTHKVFSSWQKKSDVQTSVTHILNIMTLDVLQSKLIAEVSDTTMLLIKKSDAYVRYRFEGMQIKRNDDLIGASESTRFTVGVSRIPSSEKDNQTRLLRIRIAGTSKTNAYSAETQILVPRSSKSDFINAIAASH